MDYSDIKLKNEKDLRELLNEIREQLRELRFKVGEKQVKNVRTIRELKKTVARVLTLLNQKRISKKLTVEVKK